ncbi:MAG: hypothetical protein IK055_02455 [Lachnospiraceae bacterium]|nr:hypothetical protein [Lachnospiraceae bacterium]
MKKFPVAVLCITLLLVIVSLVLAFIGAFRPEDGTPLFKTGITGLMVFPILGWVMVAVYKRVHLEDDDWKKVTPKDDAPEADDNEAEDTKTE